MTEQPASLAAKVISAFELPRIACKIRALGTVQQIQGKLGGRTRARTWDPLIKSQLLYQLSYAPETLKLGKAFARPVV